MESTIANQSTKAPSNKAIWTGRVLSSLCILFLLVDSVMKIIEHPAYIEGSIHLGWSVATVRPIGIVLLICTLLYSVPRTALLGALLLTGYLGGAIATTARLGEAYYFPMVFAVVLWGGLYLRDERLRALILSKNGEG